MTRDLPRSWPRTCAPVQANHVVALISTILNWGVDEDMVEANPAYRIKKLGAERTRDRVLTDAEIRLFWAALETEYPVYKAFYRFALLTGQRMGGKRKERGEILWMKWSEVDEATHWWTIPGERVKNGKAQRVYLTPVAREQLAAMKTFQAEKELVSEYVFVTPRSATQPVTGAKHIVRRIRERTGAFSDSGEAPDFRPHDLRWTVARLMAKAGVTNEIVKKVLNHTDRDITSIYDRHGYDTEKRRAWERWASKLKRILEAKPAIRRARSRRRRQLLPPLGGLVGLAPRVVERDDALPAALAARGDGPPGPLLLRYEPCLRSWAARAAISAARAFCPVALRTAAYPSRTSGVPG